MDHLSNEYVSSGLLHGPGSAGYLSQGGAGANGTKLPHSTHSSVSSSSDPLNHTPPDQGFPSMSLHGAGKTHKVDPSSYAGYDEDYGEEDYPPAPDHTNSRAHQMDLPIRTGQYSQLYPNPEYQQEHQGYDQGQHQDYDQQQHQGYDQGQHQGYDPQQYDHNQQHGEEQYDDIYSADK